MNEPTASIRRRLAISAALTLAALGSGCGTTSDVELAARPDSAASSVSRADDSPEAAAPAVDIELHFDGNETFTRFDLEAAIGPLLTDLRRAPLDRSGVDDIVWELERFYSDNGFLDPVIAAEWDGSDDAWEVRLRIDEGRRTYVGELVIEGNEHLAHDRLAGCFSWGRSAALGSFATHVFGVGGELLGLGTDVFSERALGAALSCVEELHRVDGYLFATATASTDDTEPGVVRVRVVVDEGPRIALETPVRLEGVRSFEAAEVHAELTLGDADWYVPRLPLVLEGRVLDFYRTRGFPWVEVHARADVRRESATASIALRVDEGRRATVRRVDIFGNEHTWSRVVRRYVRLDEGDTWDERAVRESAAGLLRAGLFEFVRVEKKRVPGADDQVDLHVIVDEKARYRATLLGGYGSWEQLRGGLVVENTNLLGSGHHVELGGSGSFRHARVEGQYRNPFFFHEDVSQHMVASWERREHPSFTDDETSVETGWSYRITEQVHGQVFHRMSDSIVSGVTGLVPSELEEDAFLSMFGVGLVHDTRDSLQNPVSGASHRLRLEYAGDEIGSELDFLRPTFAATWYVPVISRLKLVSSLRTGLIVPLRDTKTIPIQERFFAGGDSSIRSFAQDEASPRLAGELIGGEAFLTGSFELRVPIDPIRLLAGLEGAAFFDAGSVVERYEDWAGGRYYFGVGAGLRYATPVGPMRVDLAFNPDRDRGEDLFVFHFGLGYPF